MHADGPFQDPLKVTHTKDFLCVAPSYTKEFITSQWFYGRWFIFRNFEDLNTMWCVVRDEIMSGRLKAVGAKCSTLFYDWHWTNVLLDESVSSQIKKTMLKLDLDW